MAARPSTVTSELDEALTLAPLGEPGSYGAELGAGWLIGNAVNGGLLMALAGRALSVELARAGSHPDPFAVSAYYLSASTPGPATLSTEVLRTGRSVSTGQVSLTQPGDGEAVRYEGWQGAVQTFRFANPHYANMVAKANARKIVH